MVRRLVGALAVTCVLTAIVAHPVAAGDPPRATPMQFALWQEGPASSCRDKCRVWVSANGMIRTDTVRDFETFAEKNDIRGATIALDSEGGSVIGALALGRAIRRLDMTTTVGRTVEMRSGKSDPKRATLQPRADCESMCAFVLLAGTKRAVPPEARVRVHQIWLGDRREDATAATYSAEDLVLVQRDIGKLAQYTFEMGGSAEMLELSLRIPPWEPMRSLTRDELRRMHLVETGETLAGREAGLPAGAPETGAERAATETTQERRAVATTSAPPIPNIRRVAANERGWVVLRQSDATMLVRRHPLTVEGETIGSFDIMLACGASPNEFSVLYNETRRMRDQASDPLDIVSIAMGQKSAALAIGASEVVASARQERETFASGVMPASAVKAFADPGSHSLTVETSTPRNSPTSIRVGNSGVAQYFPQLVAACAQPRTKQAGLQD